MNFFETAALRLKQQLKVSEDKEVAEYLGISANAWTLRKKRGSFPETELLALCGRRPELKIDYSYVLTGVRGLNQAELQDRLKKLADAEKQALLPLLLRLLEQQGNLTEADKQAPASEHLQPAAFALLGLTLEAQGQVLIQDILDQLAPLDEGQS